MLRIEVSTKVENCLLSKDIYSDKGKLLLSEGHQLDLNDIKILISQNIKEIFIEKEFKKIEKILDGLYTKGLSDVNKIFFQAANNEKIEFDVAIKTINDIRKYISVHKELLFRLVTKNNIDDYTIQHSLNVGILSSTLAEIYGLSSSEITRIGHAGLLHDIGKALIPKEILLKPGLLTKEEFEIMKNHSSYGHEILKSNNITDEYILSATEMHHERINGFGYPYGLIGDNIPLVAQMVAIADVFDAITSKRVYKDSISIIVAFQELKNSAFKRDLSANLVFMFLDRMSYMLIGRKVLLSNDKIGKIIKPSKIENECLLLEIDGEVINLKDYPDLGMIRIIY